MSPCDVTWLRSRSLGTGRGTRSCERYAADASGSTPGAPVATRRWRNWQTRRV